MKRSAAEIVREYGPFPGVQRVHGVSFDGQHIWFAGGDRLHALDPASGTLRRSIDVAAQAGTAFDGRHLFQIVGERIQKIDPKSGRVLATIPAPGGGGDSGLAWAEGTLWVGQYRDRKIHQVDPKTGAILRTIESNRFVTGVTWVDGELWHGTWEGDQSDVRRVDPHTGEVLERLEMPPGVSVSGLESDGGDQFFCGGGGSAPGAATTPRDYPGGDQTRRPLPAPPSKPSPGRARPTTRCSRVHLPRRRMRRAGSGGVRAGHVRPAGRGQVPVRPDELLPREPEHPPGGRGTRMAGWRGQGGAAVGDRRCSRRRRCHGASFRSRAPPSRGRVRIERRGAQVGRPEEGTRDVALAAGTLGPGAALVAVAAPSAARADIAGTIVQRVKTPHDRLKDDLKHLWACTSPGVATRFFAGGISARSAVGSRSPPAARTQPADPPGGARGVVRTRSGVP
jgi:hypothetical protein